MSDLKKFFIHLTISSLLLSISGIGFITTLGEDVTEPYTVLSKYDSAKAVDSKITTEYILILENGCGEVVDLKVTPATHYLAKEGDVLHFTTSDHEGRDQKIHCHEYPWYVGPALGLPCLFILVASGIYFLGSIVALLVELFE